MNTLLDKPVCIHTVGSPNLSHTHTHIHKHTHTHTHSQEHTQILKITHTHIGLPQLVDVIDDVDAENASTSIF